MLLQFVRRVEVIRVFDMYTLYFPLFVHRENFGTTTKLYLRKLSVTSKKLLYKVRFETKSTTQWVGYFETISGHFFGNYINISHKTEVLIVILMCLTYLNPYLIKNYDIKHNFCHFCFFQFCKKKKLKNHNSQMAILWPFLAIFSQLRRQLSQNWGSDGHF